MQSRARATAMGVAVVVTILLLGWWSMSERRPEPRTSEAEALAGALEILDADGSVPLNTGAGGPKPVIDGAVQPSGEGETILGGGDGGVFGSEQPLPGYEGEVTDAIDYEPEVEEPAVGPEVVQLTEAQLAHRRQGQIEQIDQNIERLSARIDRARDEGNESIVNLLEARQRRLQQRRDTLAEM